MSIQINGTSGISGVDGTASTPALQGTDSNTGISFGTDEVNINTGGNTRAKVDSSGRLLVGTSTARSNYYNTSIVAPALQVEGTSYSTSSLSLVSNDTSAGGSYPILIFGKSAGSTIGSNTVVANNHYLGQITFQGNDGTEFVAGAEITAFVDGTPGANDMPGRLVFSTTADGASSPTGRMQIDRRGQTLIQSDGTPAVDHMLETVAAAASNALVSFRRSATLGSLGSGTEVCRIARDGDLTNTNNSYGSLSDIRLKENIVNANSQWDDLKALQVRKYNLKEETGHNTHTQIGLIAQEVELVSPGLVSESPDRDKDGNDLGTVTKSVNYSVLYMKAVKALQEAMERIETLEASNAALEARLTALEGGTAQ